MLLSPIVAVLLTTNTLYQFTTARSYCGSISSKYFQWLNTDGSLVLPTSYDAVDPFPSETYDCNKQWQTLPLFPSCQLCATSYTLVCHNPRPYSIPDPASLPVTNLSLYILSGAGLFSLPPRIFAGLSIQQLIITNTNLTYIGRETFSGVKSIKSLYLKKNNFSQLSHVGSLLKPLNNLKILNLDFNGLKTILSYKSADLKNLEYLSLKGNTFNTLDMFFLQNSGLTFLDMSYVTFAVNLKDMEDSGFSSLPSTLNTLDLSNSKISVRSMEKLFKLLKKNNITTLNAGYLKSSPRLLNALSPLRNSLQFLSLEGTDMRIALSNYNISLKLKPFVTLLELNLKNCNLEQFKKDDFRAFPNLRALSIAGNNFLNLYLTSFLTLTSLNYLDLNDNSITEIVTDSNNTLASLQVIDLSSVNMLYFQKYPLTNETIFDTFPNIKKLSLCDSKINYTVVESIKKLKNLNYLDLSSVLLNSNILSTAFSDLFSTLNSSLTELYFTRNDYKPSANNQIHFSSLQSLKTLDLSNNLIRDVTQDILGFSVATLNLSQNLITTWYYPTIQSESHAKFLDLSNNQVTYVSDAMIHDFYKLEWLDLTNNPLMCHKKVVAMVCADVKNETHNLTMASFQKYRCYDIVSNNYRLFSQPKECDDYYEEVSTTQQKLEDNTQPSPELITSPAEPLIITQRNLYSYIGFLILAAVSAIISCVIYFKWWSIKCYVHRFFTLRRAHLLRKEGPLLAKPDVHYDVFVSYSDVDRSWILDHLIPNMETDGDISLCFHERDFQVGLSILENIVECMDRSHSILLVVSSAFVRSKWCQFEMHLAQYRLIETLRNQLVLVLLEDIPKKSRPQVLHHLMMTKTYLVWPTHLGKEDATELFWKRLKRALKPNYNYIFGV